MGILHAGESVGAPDRICPFWQGRKLARTVRAELQGAIEMLLRSLGTLIILTAITGCQGRAYTMANVQLDLKKYEIVGKGETDATGLHIIGLIPVQNTNKVSRAVERILEEHGGDELINISVQESWFWALVLNGFKVHVSGTVLKKK